MRIDAHQHFWKYDPVRHDWITDDMGVLKRDFLPDDLSLLLKHEGIDGCVAVQADQSDEETRFLLNLAKQYAFIKGVVGWVDLKSEKLPARLEVLSQEKLLKGFREIMQGQPKGFMLDPKLVKGISSLLKHSFTYDVLIYSNQLDEAVELVRTLPEMPLVIDHLAKPAIKSGEVDEWKKGMARLAEFDHVYVKLSGMITEADWSGWTQQDLLPYLETTLELFGPDRLLYGSDWPVCLLAGGYSQVVEIIYSYIDQLSTFEQERIMGLNAVEFYQL